MDKKQKIRNKFNLFGILFLCLVMLSNGNSFTFEGGLRDSTEMHLEIIGGLTTLTISEPIQMRYESPAEEIQVRLYLDCVDYVNDNYISVYTGQSQVTMMEDYDFLLTGLYPLDLNICDGIYMGNIVFDNGFQNQLVEISNLINFQNGVGEIPMPTFTPLFNIPPQIDNYDSITGEITILYEPDLNTFTDELINIEQNLYLNIGGELILIENRNITNYVKGDRPISEIFNVEYNGDYILDVKLFNANTLEEGESDSNVQFTFNNGIPYPVETETETEEIQTFSVLNNLIPQIFRVLGVIITGIVVLSTGDLLALIIIGSFIALIITILVMLFRYIKESVNNSINLKKK